MSRDASVWRHRPGIGRPQGRTPAGHAIFQAGPEERRKSISVTLLVSSAFVFAVSLFPYNCSQVWCGRLVFISWVVCNYWVHLIPHSVCVGNKLMCWVRPGYRCMLHGSVSVGGLEVGVHCTTPTSDDSAEHTIISVLGAVFSILLLGMCWGAARKCRYTSSTIVACPQLTNLNCTSLERGRKPEHPEETHAVTVQTPYRQWEESNPDRWSPTL
ncbi:uncharacterized protein LOC134355852 [Mobula hypostoma]|uniref:uncharacterized protein LOC134355852 n=1 Tax=Mobula hypostoma TaxID=723540 RepID=UPI002FC39D9B